jgi:uncharacterized protein
MHIDSSFELPLEIGVVWSALLDVERIAPCLPGAAITGKGAGDEYEGMMRVKLGPVTSTFKGTLEITEADEATHRVVLRAAARDVSGRGAAGATITSVLARTGAGTRVQLRTELTLAGTAGQFGRAVVEDVSQKLVRDFAARLAAEIEHPAAAAQTVALDGVSQSIPCESATAYNAATTRQDALDLTAAGKDALRRRLAPAGAGLVGLLIVFLATRVRGGRRSPVLVINGPLVVIGRRTHSARRR